MSSSQYKIYSPHCCCLGTKKVSLDCTSTSPPSSSNTSLAHTYPATPHVAQKGLPRCPLCGAEQNVWSDHRQVQLLFLICCLCFDHLDFMVLVEPGE